MKKKQGLCAAFCAYVMLPLVLSIIGINANAEITLQEKLYSNIESRGIPSSMAIELSDGKIIASGMRNDIAFLICLNEKAETIWKIEFPEAAKSKIISFVIIQKNIWAIEEIEYEWPRESEFFLLQVRNDMTYQREEIGAGVFTPQKIVAAEKNIY